MANMDRRKFLILGGATIASTLLPSTASASFFSGTQRRELALSSIHTGEFVSCEYHNGKDYLKDELARLDSVCRDFRRNEVISMDKILFDKLAAIREKLNTQAPIKIVSGYRSPATNEMLRGKSSSVAKKSYHMTGQAIDFFIEDTPMTQVYKAARSLNSGGVGRYRDFIHIDTGPTRTWGG